MARSRLLNRRQFTGLAASATVGTLAFGTVAGKAATAGASQPAAGRGIWKVIRNPKALESPLGMAANEIWRYLLSFPFQAAPNVAALYCNLKMCGGPGQDFEGGSDLLLFDRLSGLSAEKAVKVSRQHLEPNPNAGGQMSVMAKYPGLVGFVPLGAKLPNGQPHPHAGTGFVLVVAVAWPTDNSQGYVTYPDRIGRGTYPGEKLHRTLELHQVRFDGTVLTVSSKEILSDPDAIAGYRLDSGGMGCAIADGDDLLTGIRATKRGSQAATAGLLRWRRTRGQWRPAGYEPVTPEDNSMEPSVMRDLDGSLLVGARGPRASGPPLRVWRQTMPGQPWELRIHINGMLPSTPVALSRATDGTPFITGNLYQPEFRLPQGLHSDGGLSRLEPVGWRGERSTLCVWPLNETRNGLDAQLIARDPRVEFGLPPHGTVWAADHAVACPMRLADGQWHCLMGYRVLEWKENTHFIPPSPQTGSYLDEIVSFGEPAPLWNF